MILCAVSGNLECGHAGSHVTCSFEYLFLKSSGGPLSRAAGYCQPPSTCRSTLGPSQSLSHRVSTVDCSDVGLRRAHHTLQLLTLTFFTTSSAKSSSQFILSTSPLTHPLRDLLQLDLLYITTIANIDRRSLCLSRA